MSSLGLKDFDILSENLKGGCHQLHSELTFLQYEYVKIIFKKSIFKYLLTHTPAFHFKILTYVCNGFIYVEEWIQF